MDKKVVKARKGEKADEKKKGSLFANNIDAKYKIATEYVSSAVEVKVVD